jgi:phospholipase C
MFENRSFDNVLGHLYSSAEKSAADFDGSRRVRTRTQRPTAS